MNLIEKPDFTPYEGCLGEWVPRAQFFSSNSKSFGYFQCNYCHKNWMSAFARKNYKQGCKQCDRYFLPVFMWINS